MKAKKFGYTEIDGNHWPDADAGDDLYYSLNFECYLESEQETISDIEWMLPEGVTSSDDSIVGVSGLIKLATPYPGIFTIKCKLTTMDTGREQSQVIPMKLKVI